MLDDAPSLLLLKGSIALFGLGSAALFLFALVRRRASLAALVCFVLFLAGCLFYVAIGGRSALHHWGSDDAYISYRYAHNLVQGHGLVFNPGERVEGYSNLLYTLLVAAGILVSGPENAYAFSAMLNVLFAFAALFVFYRHLAIRFGKHRALFPLLLVALCPPLWKWVASGLETPLILLIQVGAWITAERALERESRGQIALLCLLAASSVLARADGFILPAIVILYLLVERRPRVAAYCAASLASTLALYLLWRHDYYGYLLPNTYYAKVSGPLPSRVAHALSQLAEVSWATGLWLYLSMILCSLGEPIRRFAQGGSRLFDEVRFFHVFTLGWLAYWIYVGGDHFDERFLIVLFPMGAFALLQLLERGFQTKVAVLFVVVFLVIQMKPALGRVWSLEDPESRHDALIAAGKFVGEEYPGKVIATCASGKVPYFSDLRTIDMLGLNDEFIAHKDVGFFGEPGHNKYDPDYVISRRPDVIVTRFGGEGLDLRYGLTREKYLAGGYAIRYLLFTGRISREDANVVDVRGFDPREIEKRVDEGYGFAVLERR